MSYTNSSKATLHRIKSLSLILTNQSALFVNRDQIEKMDFS